MSAAPGLFAQNASGSGPGAILNQDNSLNGPGHPAAKGSIVQVYLTGEGQTNPPGVTGRITPVGQVGDLPQLVLPIQVCINGQQAGVMQLNAQIPLYWASGPLAIQVRVGGYWSQNGITLEVQ